MRYSAAGQGIASPFAQLPGNGKYIVRFPAYGGTSGTLLLNPTDEDVAGFTLFHLSPDASSLPGGLSSWRDMNLYGCLVINGKPYRANTFLDTGNPEIEVLSPAFGANSVVPAGQAVLFGLADALYSDFRIQTGFAVGNSPVPGVDRVDLETYNTTTMNYPAIMPYFKFNVLYDQTNGIIGLKVK